MGIIHSIKKCFQSARYSSKIRRIKRSFFSCGDSIKIYGNPVLVSPKRISIGDRVTLNDRCVLNATASSIKLGNDIIVSSDAKIMAATIDTYGFICEHRRNHIIKEISIGDNVWICAGAIICPGVHIKGNCIIAAGAVVAKDINEENVVVAGNPAHVVKTIG